MASDHESGWGDRAPTPAGTPYGLADDSSSHLVVGGRFETSIDFGNGVLVAAGQGDGLVAKLTP